jgi:hypothetical protein
MRKFHGVLIFFIIFLLSSCTLNSQSVPEPKKASSENYISALNEKALEKTTRREPIPIVNPSEPWTGKWNVEGSAWTGGIWAFKQTGDTVRSTEESYFTAFGTVTNDKLEGTYVADHNGNCPYIFFISPDGMSFTGYATWRGLSKPVKGIRLK